MYASTITIVHKYIRRELSQFAHTLATMGPSGIAEAEYELDMLVGMLKGHAQMEDRAFRPVITEINPAFAKRMEDDHHALDAELDAIINRFKSLYLVPDEDFELEVHQLYLNWNRFSADYLQHLDTEERDIFSLLPRSALNLNGLIANLLGMEPQEAEAFKTRLWAVTNPAEQKQIEEALETAR